MKSALGAISSLPRASGNVRSPKPQRSLALRGGNWSSCPEPALQDAASEWVGWVDSGPSLGRVEAAVANYCTGWRAAVRQFVGPGNAHDSKPVIHRLKPRHRLFNRMKDCSCCSANAERRRQRDANECPEELSPVTFRVPQRGENRRPTGSAFPARGVWHQTPQTPRSSSPGWCPVAETPI